MATPEVPQKESEFEKLRVPIQDIIAFTNTLDEKYREKCFEVLLNFYIHKDALTIPVSTEAISAPKADPVGSSAALSPLIKGFLAQNKISVETVDKLFLRENGEVVPIYEVQKGNKAAAQIQLAMLSAFRNALIDPSTIFEFSVENVRELCKEKEVYDLNNFAGTFKKQSNLFKDFATTDEEHVKLTSEGKKELAETVLAVSSQ